MATDALQANTICQHHGRLLILILLSFLNKIWDLLDKKKDDCHFLERNVNLLQAISPVISPLSLRVN